MTDTQLRGKWGAALLALLLLGVQGNSQTNFLSITGTAGLTVGESVASVGDMTGDGVPEIASGGMDTLTGEGVVTLFSGIDGAIEFVFLPSPSLGFGPSVDGGADLDQDNVPDIVIGSPGWNNSSGAVHVYSGATKALIRTHFGQPNQRFGDVVRILPDLDDDGVAEYAVGAPHDGSISGPGTAYVYSGATGALKYPLVGGGGTGDLYGYAIADVGDIDLDNVPDFAVGAPGLTISKQSQGGVFLYSGATGSFLRVDEGVAKFALFGLAIAGVDDVNGDSVPDYVTTRFHFNLSTNAAAIMSGASEQLLKTIFSPLDDEQYLASASIASIDDQDGDGIRDVVMRNRPSVGSATDGHALVSSSSTANAQYLIMDDDSDASAFADIIAAQCDDFDGDGSGDVLVASKWEQPTGVVEVYSLRSLVALQDQLPANTGAAIPFDLNGGVPRAGDTYIVLGGFSGTTPGFNVGITHVPINYDLFTAWTVNLANVPPFVTTFGTLDAVDGKASASFDMTGIPLPPAAVGLTLSFAYAVKGDVGGAMDGGDAAGVAWYFASNPENVAIVASIPGG